MDNTIIMAMMILEKKEEKLTKTSRELESARKRKRRGKKTIMFAGFFHPKRF